MGRLLGDAEVGVNAHIKNIVIVGGGTAGWMAAAALSRALGTHVAITLVESADIPTVGVGEATIPPIIDFLRFLDIDEDDFVARTNATFKLGIEFAGWSAAGSRYMHPFGKYGFDMEGIAFHHYWHKLRANGDTHSLEDYSLETAAARAGKFTRPLAIERSPLANITYALHFDAGLVAKYLRGYAEARGIKRIEAKITGVRQRGEDGFIEAVVLDTGDTIAGELFIDCTGFGGLLIEQALGAGYEDWSHWLPCDRAIAVPCAANGPPLPYTRATAHPAGWQWRIALQNRIGNGHVYCSQYMSDDEAAAILLANLDGAPLADPRQLRFTTGRRKLTWVKNCVALGLSSGFLEPLESTSIHMIQSALMRLIAFFPTPGFASENTAEYNRRTRDEYESMRDFLILHYNATQRDDSAFWNSCRTRENPDSLDEKIALFRATGHVTFREEELFVAKNWIAVMTGQGIVPQRHHPLADMIGTKEVARRLAGMRATIATSADYMPYQAQFIAENCAAG